jgi:hypothetical protein
VSNAECCYAECRYAECRYAECCYAEAEGSRPAKAGTRGENGKKVS